MRCCLRLGCVLLPCWVLLLLSSLILWGVAAPRGRVGKELIIEIKSVFKVMRKGSRFLMTSLFSSVDIFALMCGINARKYRLAYARPCCDSIFVRIEIAVQNAGSVMRP